MSVQQADGAWGGGAEGPASVEETALAVDALAATLLYQDTLLSADEVAVTRRAIQQGADALTKLTQNGTVFEPAPIGLSFPRLRYYEDLSPIALTLSALHKARCVLK